MKIRYNLAGKTLRTDVSAAVQTGLELTEAIRQWAEDKFTAWAQREELTPPSVTLADAEGVELEATAETGARFVKEVGGREIV